MGFKKISMATLIILYLLVLAGGIVRSTGSGMGCPDWPTCFGRIIPPTNESQLPLNYQEIYQEKLHGEIIFNPVKTWIEYLNRLLGALTGIAMLLTTFFAFKKDKKTGIFALGALFFVLANAILGKYVVDSFLLPGVVTAHMVLTIAVLFFLLLAIYHDSNKISLGTQGYWIIILNIILVVSQIITGTQVRENMDQVILELGESQKHLWIDHLDFIYIIHRSATWFLIIANIFLYRKFKKNTIIKNYLNGVFFLLGISILTGILMAYFALPFGTQPLHLTLSLLALGLHLKMLITTNYE